MRRNYSSKTVRLGCRSLFGRGSGAAFNSELRSLWQTDFATPRLPRIGLPKPSGRGNAVACSEETSGLCGKRLCHPPRAAGKGLPKSVRQRQRICLQKRAPLAVANRFCHPKRIRLCLAVLFILLCGFAFAETIALQSFENSANDTWTYTANPSPTANASGGPHI